MAHSTGIAILLTLLSTSALVAQDFTADVQKACTHPRLGLRIAASKKVAEAGDAAVPAIRAFAKAEGQDRIPVALVETLADKAGLGPAVVSLLEAWATDPDFYWRAQALRGLALRAPRLPEQRARFVDLFQRFADDPAWLPRVFARLGLDLLAPTGDLGKHPAAETDPRALSKLAAVRLTLGQAPPLQPLLDAMADERGFLGDPWGRRRGLEAFRALSTWLGDNGGYNPDAGFEQNRAALDKLRQLAATKSGQTLQLPTPQLDPELAITGGIEVFSCKNGDLYLSWTASGTVLIGLQDDHRVSLDHSRWQQLMASAEKLDLPSQTGVVICDKLRLVLENPARQGMIAPTAMPAITSDWLKQLAAAIEEAGDGATADALRHRLGQFAAR